MQNSVYNFIKQTMNLLADFNKPDNLLQQDVLQLGIKLRGLAEEKLGKFRGINDPSNIKSGMALDPWQAAYCAEDIQRSIKFLRGCIKVINEKLKINNKPIHMVEAGCGPLGLIAVPLMIYFSPEELQITLVDLHEPSIESVKSIIDQLELQESCREIICADVTTLEFKTSVDIIFTETMRAALSNEPQVFITKHLVAKCPNATLIPNNIEINLVLMNPELEFQTFPHNTSCRIQLGKIFELNSDSAKRIAENENIIPAGNAKIPSTVEEGFGLAITTKVNVYDDFVLQDYDSIITTPVMLNDQNIFLESTLNFSYQMGENPGFHYLIENVT